MQPFLDALNERVILADGAMGTQVYERGVFINRCFEELNLSHPDLIRAIHNDYLAAGAELIETNTFRAHRAVLAGHGLAEHVEAINVAAVKIAREAAQNKAYVAGSVGPLGVLIAPLGRISQTEAAAIFAEQVAALDAAGVDCIILETFLSMYELDIAYRAAKSVTERPIITQLAFRLDDQGEVIGAPADEVARTMSSWGAAVIGTNCVNGPEASLRIIEAMRGACDTKLSAMPNAGLPQVIEGRTIYLASPEYMAEYARRLVQQGASLIGGCCGTTPAQIAEIAKFLRSITPNARVQIAVTPVAGVQTQEPPVLAERSAFGAALGKKFVVSVEIEPPKGLNPQATIDGAKFLHEHGVDAVNIADGARAMARMSPIAMALRIREQVPIETVIHYCCRDRNLLGMQMDLLGAHALNVNNLLIITGDPPKMGDFPHATAVFDVDAIGLLHLANQMNHGVDWSGRALGGTTKFVLGCGCNPGAINLELEVERFRKKIVAGAEYVFSQPMYDPQMLDNFLERSKNFPRIPFFVGILPLASLKNAEFLHNEVPGMQIPPATMDRMRKAGESRDAQRREGIAIARETLAAAKQHPRVQGAYIFPPFGSYPAVIEVMEGLK